MEPCHLVTTGDRLTDRQTDRATDRDPCTCCPEGSGSGESPPPGARGTGSSRDSYLGPLLTYTTLALNWPHHTENRIRGSYVFLQLAKYLYMILRDRANPLIKYKVVGKLQVISCLVTTRDTGSEDNLRTSYILRL